MFNIYYYNVGKQVLTLKQALYTTKDKTYWFIVISLGLASFFIFATMYFFQPILPVLVSMYDVRISYASLTMSLHTVGLVIGLIVIGFLSDRRGRRVFVLLSILLTTIILFLLPKIPYFSLIIALRFIQGFTLAGVLSAALAYMSEEMNPRYFGFAATLYISSNSLGGMMGRFVSSYLVEAYSYQFALNLLGWFGLLVFILVVIFLPQSRNFNKSTKRLSEDMRSFTYHLKNPILLLMFGLGAVLQISFTGMWTFLPFHLIEDPFNLSLQQIAYFYFAYSLGTIGAPIAGWLSRKYELSTLRLTGVVILTIGMVTTLGTSLVYIVIGLSIICLGFFISHSLASATVSNEASTFKGSASSLYLVSYYIGVAIGTTLLTPIWEKFAWNGIITITALLPITYVVVVKLIQLKQT